MESRSRCEAVWTEVDILCETHLKVTKLSYTWTLDNFSLCREGTGKKIISSTFSTAENGNPNWCVDLYPNGVDEESKNYVSIYLRLVWSVDDFLAQFKFAVLDEGGREAKTYQWTSRFRDANSFGWKMFIERDRLLKSTDSLLPNDKLTIYCEVLAFVDSVDITSEHSALEVNVPECQLSQDFRHLLESRRLCDVILCVEGKEIHAHKSILAARCPVFAAMFEHGMKQKEESRVEMTDFDFEVLHEVVEFIYTGRAPKLNKMADKVLVAANKYDLGRLKAMCEDILCAKLSVTTAAQMLVLGDMHNADQLKANAVRCIKEHVTGVLETDGWKVMAGEKPHLVTEAFCALAVENVALKTEFGSKLKLRRKRNSN